MKPESKKLIDRLEQNKMLEREEYMELLRTMTDENVAYIREKARTVANQHFGNKVYTRGLIEFTNYCKNNCYYCGIRCGNRNVERYRLTKNQILSCCKSGYELGFRTFVLQGGEDLDYTEDEIVEIIQSIREQYEDCAITLSIGERSYQTYHRFYNAGANRYLLRHETANVDHYSKLHPSNLTLENRKQCLYDLKSIGYQVGTGIMVGSPYQTVEHIAEDLIFINDLSPQMIGIGPFLPHHDTPFANEAQGSYEQTLYLISILRLMIPNALIPATTALGTIHPLGREEGILSGANVVMPNLSPIDVRKKYELYDNKICTGEEAAECRVCLHSRMKKIGYELAIDKGDFKPII